MTTQEKQHPPLDQEATVRLTDFARACKAAARAVTLYPSTHPAIKLSMGRLVDAATRMTSAGPVSLGVAPDNLLVDGAAAARPDQAVRETAAMFHDHMIGILKVHETPDPEGWMPFLGLLAKPLDEIRAAGGIGRLWAATGRNHLSITEIDYADILLDRGKGQVLPQWDDIIRACLNLDSPLDDDTLKNLVGVCLDSDRFSEFVLALDHNDTGSSTSKAAALLRMLRGVVDLVARTDPGKLGPMLQNLSEGFGKLSPELLLELLSTEPGRADAAADLVLQVASRMTDETVGGFVARSVMAENGASTRLAQAFQALVPDKERRPALLELAKAELEESPLGSNEGFLELWKNTSEMLTSYSDEAFVSQGYARELMGARTKALDVERVSDDPPERISAWVTSVAPAEIRALDLRLLLDLLSIETDPERWRKVTAPAISHIEDLLLVGDIDGASQLIHAIAAEIKNGTQNKPAAESALHLLVQGSMMVHITSHLRTVDDQTVEQIKSLCYAVGPSVIRPLAETLAIEKRTGARQRLTQLLIGFGAAGKQSVERLKTSANPAVRRTAVYLLREFGGSEALSDLAALLDDAEPHIQREAVRGILQIGTEDAYSELQKALATGTDRTRETLMEALTAMRNERAIPLFEYIVRKVDRKGPLRSVYLRAIESLGALKAAAAVELLREALYAGEWWAPFRTAETRRTVASALRKIGTAESQRVLEDASTSGPRGVRAAVKGLHA